MLQAIERYMKQAIVDKVPSVSSSALVSSLVNKCQSPVFFLCFCVIEIKLWNSISYHCCWVMKSSLFVCVQHMVKMSYDVVKRWVNEAQEAASSDNIMVQVDSTDYIKTLRFMLL